MNLPLSIFCFLLTGLTSLHGQSMQKLVVDFKEIDSLQYVEYKKEYSNPLKIDSTKQTIPDSSFYLVIKNEKQWFDCQKDYSPCHYYRGFLQPLNSYVITHCGMLTCETFIIDQATGERNHLFSPFDNESETPVLSKDTNKMLVFASNVFDREAYIALYQRKDKQEAFNFESYASLTTDKWKIFEAIWIDDTSFALISFDEYGGISGNELLNVRYVRGELKH